MVTNQLFSNDVQMGVFPNRALVAARRLTIAVADFDKLVAVLNAMRIVVRTVIRVARPLRPSKVITQDFLCDHYYFK